MRDSYAGVKEPKLLDSAPPRFYTVEELNTLYLACRNQRPTTQETT